MPRFVALLKGVNIGKARRVPMADFRALLAGLGYSHVATLLNSGNAVFGATTGTADQHARDIAAAISGRLGLEVPVVVKSAAELEAIVAEDPIKAETAEHSRYLVAFTQDSKALASLAVIEPLVIAPERLAIGRHAAYLYCATGILQSQAGKALLGKPGIVVTIRNYATVLRLQRAA